MNLNNTIYKWKKDYQECQINIKSKINRLNKLTRRKKHKSKNYKNKLKYLRNNQQLNKKEWKLKQVRYKKLQYVIVKKKFKIMNNRQLNYSIRLHKCKFNYMKIQFKGIVQLKLEQVF